MKLYTRDLDLASCHLKFNDTSRGVSSFEGYASVWDRVDSYGDTVKRGAFLGSIGKKRPMMFFGHNPGRVIGKWVELAEDHIGLRVVGELTPGHSEAANVAASLKHGAISGLSIGGWTESGEDVKNGGRIIKSFDLIEISVVSMPAEDAARIDLGSVKSMIETCKTTRDIERLLRDALQLPRSQAVALIAKMTHIARGDLDEKRQTGTEDVAGMLAALDALPVPR